MPRPTGLDEREYVNWQKWTGNRWAWEFLRRNPQFQSDCRTVDQNDSPARRNELCEKWGLRRYKSYKEPYRKHGKPASFVTSVRILGSRRKLRNVQLADGQVAVVFNCLFSLRKQLAYAAERLKRRQEALEKSGKRIERTNKKPRPVNFLYCLRALDVEQLRGLTKKQMAEAIYGDKRIAWATVEQTRRDHLKQGKGYRDSDYRIIPWVYNKDLS
jgi:hypothetical protein